MKTRLLLAVLAVGFLGTMGIANAENEGKGKKWERENTKH